MDVGVVKTRLGSELSAFMSLSSGLSSLFTLFLTAFLTVTRMAQDSNRLRLDEGGKALHKSPLSP